MLIRAAIISLLLISPVAAATQPVAGQQNPNRVALERQLRERTAQITRQRLGLNDAQMQQLQRVNGRFAPQHTALAMRERDTRRQLRQETMATSPNQAAVSGLLDATIALQRQRLALMEAEQKELAVFLTPVQRARYIALQGQFRRAAENLARPGQGGRLRNNMRRPGPGAERRP